MTVLSPSALAHALGGEFRGDRVYAPGPGHSRHDRSLAILVDARVPDGFIVESFSGDDWPDCKDYVRARAGLPASSRCAERSKIPPVAPPPGSVSPATKSLERSYADRVAYALALWSQAGPPQATPVATYLAGRCLSLPDDVLAADALRYHLDCPFGRERHPAMLALMRDIVGNAPRAIHRTALRPDGAGKAEMADGGSPKRMLGPVAGCAVKLIDDAEVTIGLGIAEGIENALTALCAGWSPVWAAGCKGGLAKFPVLAGIDALTIFSDPEPGGVEAARACARRWQNAGHEGTVVIPPGSDWNDVRRTT